MNSIYNMKCPVHNKITMYSDRMLSFDFSIKSDKIMSGQYNEKNDKAGIVKSPLFYCSICKKMYISNTTILNNNETIILDKNIHIKNCKKVCSKVKEFNSKYENDTIYNINSRLIMNGISKLFNWDYVHFDYQNDKCKFDNKKLKNIGEINIGYTDLITKKSMSYSSTRYICPDCNKRYISDDFITFLKYNLKSSADINYIQVMEDKKRIDYPFNYNGDLCSEVNKETIDVITTNSKYSIDDIVFKDSISEKCLYDNSELLYDPEYINIIKKDGTNIYIAGNVCLKCNRLYIKNDLSRNHIIKSIKEESEISEVVVCNDLLHSIYSKKYKKNLSLSIGIGCILTGKSIKAVSDIITKYNYVITEINKSKELEGLNEDLRRYFELDDFKDIFAYSQKESLEQLMQMLDWNNIMLRRVDGENGCNIDLSFTIKNLKDKKCKLILSFSNNMEIGINQISSNYCNLLTIKIYEDKYHFVIRSASSVRFIKDIYKIYKYCFINPLIKSHILNPEVLVRDALSIESKKPTFKKLRLGVSFKLTMKTENTTIVYGLDKRKPDSNVTVIMKDGMLKNEFKDKNCEIIKPFLIKNAIEAIEKKKDEDSKRKSKKEFDKRKLKIKEKVLKADDYIIRTTVNKCFINSHKLNSVNIIVPVLSTSGLLEVEISASYCEICNGFYVLEQYYSALKRYGYICCKVDKYEDFISKTEKYFDDLKDKSILMTYGYNVKQSAGLSDDKRHEILSFVIANSIMSEDQIISFLEWRINLIKKLPNMKNAIKKYENDIHFLYGIDSKDIRNITDKFKTPIKRIVIS